MAIDSQWYNAEQTAIITNFQEKWTWPEFHAAVREMHHMAAQIPHTVDLILVHYVDHAQGDPMAQFRRAFANQPHNIGKVIVAYPNMRPTTLRLIKLFARVFDRPAAGGAKVFIVASLEEGQRLLAEPQPVET